MFNDPLLILVGIAILVVFGILLMGIGNFGKGEGGEDRRKRSNTLMRYRIYAQAAAVVLIMLFVWLRGRGG